MCTYLLKPFLSVSSVIWRTCKVNIELSNTAISVQHFSDVHIKKFHVKIRGGGTHNYRLKADLRWYWKKLCKIRNLPWGLGSYRWLYCFKRVKMANRRKAKCFLDYFGLKYANNMYYTQVLWQIMKGKIHTESILAKSFLRLIQDASFVVMPLKILCTFSCDARLLIPGILLCNR